MIECILDPNGVISVYQGKQIPTGRKKTRTKGYAGYGDLNPKNTRLYQLLKDQIDPSVLDDEELMYGTTKCDDGKFGIRAAYEASRMPRGIRNAMQRELVKRADGKIHGFLFGAIERIGEIATSPASDDKDAFKAAQWIVERALGKTPDVQVHVQEKKYEVVLENISRGSRRESRAARGLESNAPLEAELVEDE